MQSRNWIIFLSILITACAAPAIDDWPPAPLDASDEVIQQYVDRYAHKEQAPRVYTEIELKALQILQERARYQDSASHSRLSNQPSLKKESSGPKERSRAQINAIKRKVYRKYEGAHERRHELRSKYGL